jgi:hypothetical protein
MEKINYYINESKSPGVVMSVATDKGRLKTGQTLSYAVVRIKKDPQPSIDLMLSHSTMAVLCEQLIISLYGYRAAEEFEKITLELFANVE